MAPRSDADFDASRWSFLRSSRPTHDRRPSKPERITFGHLSPISGHVALDYIPHSDLSIARPDRVLVFILGNPGILEYYHPFLLHLSTVLPRTAIISTSHIGHTPDLPAPAERLTLEEQLEAKVELISSLRRALDAWGEGDEGEEDGEGDDGENGVERDEVDADWVDASLDFVSSATSSHKGHKGQRMSGDKGEEIGLVLMGHSIGAWMAVETAKRLQATEEEVDAEVMLFPTVGWIADSPNGRRLKHIFRAPLIHLLPIFATLLTPLLLLLTALPSLASLLHLPPPTLSLLRSPRTIRHVLHLAKSEMGSVGAPDLDWFEAASALRPYTSPRKADGETDNLQSEHAGRRGVQGGQTGQREREAQGAQAVQGVYGIWSDHGVDKWVGREGELVQCAMGGEEGGRVRVVGKIPHAFCLSLQHSEYVAGIVASWIRRSAPFPSISTGSRAEQTVDETVSSFPM